jgi:hypothetical protein
MHKLVIKKKNIITTTWKLRVYQEMKSKRNISFPLSVEYMIRFLVSGQMPYLTQKNVFVPKGLIIKLYLLHFDHMHQKHQSSLFRHSHIQFI